MIRYWVFFLLAACGRPATWDDLRAEGEAEARALAQILHNIDTKEELQKSLPKIKKRFNKIADLALEVRELKEKSAMPENRDPSEASDALFVEMARLYEMPGCRDLIEMAQNEAVRQINR